MGYRLAILVAVLLLQMPQAWAGAWTLPRNRWYAEYFYRHFASKKSFDSEGHSGRKPKVGMFRDIRNEWKLEYGLTDWWNLLASVPYQSAHYRDDSVDLLNSNVGDIYVRTKFRWLENPVVSSVQFSWKIPSAYNPNESPGLGDGQVDFESRIQFSRSWTFAPYQVPVRTHRNTTSQTRGSATIAQRHTVIDHALTSREQAIRDALMVSALSEYSRRLAGRRGSMPQVRLASAQFETTAEAEEMPAQEPQVEPFEEDVEMETRYARVAYVNVEGAFTARNEDPANEFPLLFEAGFTPLTRLMLVGSLESVVAGRSTHEQEEEFSKWGLRAIINIWGDGFANVFRRAQQNQASVNLELGYNDVFEGRNTDDAYEVFGKIGVFF